MKKILSILLIIFSFSFAQKAISHEWTPEDESLKKPELEVSLKIKQENFFLGQPVIVDIYIKNTDLAENTVTLKLKKDLIDNLELHLINGKNNQISPSMEYLSKLQKQRDDKQKEYLYEFSKELETQTVELNYGETFVTHIDLNNFFELDEGMDYFLSGNFLLTIALNENNNAKINFPMNRIFFRVQENTSKPASQTSETLPSITDSSKINNSSKDNAITPPYETVRIFLEAQKNHDWAKHFEMVDLFNFLSKSYSATPLYERFISAESNEKDFILKDFKDTVIQGYDYEIKSFDVYQSFIDKDEAIVKSDVVANQRFKIWGKAMDPVTQQVEEKWNVLPNSQTESKFVFTFHLKKFNGMWKIIQKDVTIGEGKKINRTIVEEQPIDNNFKEVVYFDLGKYDIKTEYLANLKNVKDYLRLNPRYVITLKGYTDETGNDGSNLLLSRKRSLRIKQYLIDKLGIGGDRINLSWYGKQDPASVNHALNRRVEIIISKP